MEPENIMEILEEPVEEILEEPVEEILKKPVVEILKVPVEKSIKEPVEEIIKEPVGEITKEPVEKKTPIKDMTVQLIRDELRDVKVHIRKTHRDSNLSKNRSTLGQLSRNIIYTEEFVTVTAKSLRKKTLDIQDYRKLQIALIQSEKNINAFFKVANAVQGISRDLSGRSTQAKLAAANCCCNLALGNSKACGALSRFVGPYLIAELENTNEPLVEVCAWTIGNLAFSDKAFTTLKAQGCMRSLINLARQCSDALLPAASYALLRFMYVGFSLLKETDIIEVGEILSVRYPKVSDKDTMWLLALLSSDTNKFNFLLKCTPELCNYLKASEEEDDDIDKFTAALRIMGNIITEPSGDVATQLFPDDEFKENCYFIEDLLSHKYFHIRNETLWLLGNLYNHPEKFIREKAKRIVESTSPDVEGALKTYKEITLTVPLVKGQAFSYSLE